MDFRILTSVFASSVALLWSGLAFAGPACNEWLRLSPRDQAVAMRGFIDETIPSSIPPATVECLRSMDAEIASHATELCKRDGGDFVPAASTALTTAIEHCQTR